MTQIIAFILKNWQYFLIAILSLVLWLFISINNANVKELQLQKQNVEVLNSLVDTFEIKYNTGLKTINGKDSIINLNAAKISSLTYTANEYKRFNEKDAQTIKDLKISLKNAENASNITTQTITNTVIQLKDSCFEQKTEFQDISGCIKNDKISIKSVNRDSLLAVISTKSKHHFLFFHWGVKITDLNVVSKNPNTTITGLKFTVIKK